MKAAPIERAGRDSLQSETEDSIGEEIEGLEEPIRAFEAGVGPDTGHSEFKGCGRKTTSKALCGIGGHRWNQGINTESGRI
jgi:hypothetical protein